MLAACLLHNIDIAVVSECLCHLRAQYPIQCPDIRDAGGAPVKEYLHTVVAVGRPWYQSMYTLQLLLGRFESNALAHYSCYWGPFESVAHRYYSCLWGPIESRVLTHCSYCWGCCWKQSAYTSVLQLGSKVAAGDSAKTDWNCLGRNSFITESTESK